MLSNITTRGHGRASLEVPVSKIDEVIKVPLSKKILFEKLQNVHVTADVWYKGKRARIKLDTKPKGSPADAYIDTNGIVTVNETQE